MELPLVATAVSSNIPTGLLIVGWPIDCWTVVSSAVHIFRSRQCFKLCITQHSSRIFIRGAPVATGGGAVSNAPPPVATQLLLTHSLSVRQDRSHPRITHNGKRVTAS